MLWRVGEDIRSWQPTTLSTCIHPKGELRSFWKKRKGMGSWRFIQRWAQGKFLWRHTLALRHAGRLVWLQGTLRVVKVFGRIPLKEHPIWNQETWVYILRSLFINYVNLSTSYSPWAHLCPHKRSVTSVNSNSSFLGLLWGKVERMCGNPSEINVGYSYNSNKGQITSLGPLTSVVAKCA